MFSKSIWRQRRGAYARRLEQHGPANLNALVVGCAQAFEPGPPIVTVMAQCRNPTRTALVKMCLSDAAQHRFRSDLDGQRRLRFGQRIERVGESYRLPQMARQVIGIERLSSRPQRAADIRYQRRLGNVKLTLFGERTEWRDNRVDQR
ncbi:hypothetical protein D3C85_1478020 [compost metagenome]